MVVLACETGGRFSEACRDLMKELVASKVRESLEILCASLAAGWYSRWWAILSVASQDALAASLSEASLRLLDAADGLVPTIDDVLLDA